MSRDDSVHNNGDLQCRALQYLQSLYAQTLGLAAYLSGHEKNNVYHAMMIGTTIAKVSSGHDHNLAASMRLSWSSLISALPNSSVCVRTLCGNANLNASLSAVNSSSAPTCSAIGKKKPNNSDVC